MIPGQIVSALFTWEKSYHRNSPVEMNGTTSVSSCSKCSQPALLLVSCVSQNSEVRSEI